MDGSDALARCVGDARAFLEHAWGQVAHLHRDADIARLLTLDDVDHLLAEAALRAPAMRMVKDGSPVPPPRYLRTARIGSRTVDDLVDPGRAHELFADGATVVLQGLQRYWPPLTAFCRELELRLDHPAQANAYLTPPGAAGLDAHADPHDVFAAQTHGEKHWTTWPRGTPVTDLGAPDLDHTMVTGDVLYVPRGVPHLVRTAEHASLHVTIGVRVTTWADLVRAAADEALDDQGLQEALPVGWTSAPERLSDGLRRRLEAVADRLREVPPAPHAHAAARRFHAGRVPSLRGQLSQLLALDAIDDASLLERRTGATCRLIEEGDAAVIALGDRRVSFPARVAPALRWVAERDQLAVGDLRPYLDADGRCVLARRLVREGLLVRRG